MRQYLWHTVVDMPAFLSVYCEFWVGDREYIEVDKHHAVCYTVLRLRLLPYVYDIVKVMPPVPP